MKYVDTASQIPLNTSLAQHNTNKYKQLDQNRNELALAPRETQILNSKFPQIRRHFANNFKSHHPQINSVLFASHPSTIQSCNFNSKNKLSSKFFSEINSINQFNNNMPSKKRITRVRFNDTSRALNQQPSSQNLTRLASPPSNASNKTRTASQRTTSSNTTRAASPLQILTPQSPAHLSNASTPLTPSPHLPIFDYIVSKIFIKYLIASLTSKDVVLKEVGDCMLTNNESHLKALKPYIHSYWRDLHVRSGCVCIDKKEAIQNVLREALTEDIHASHPGTWGKICMATHCWWPYMHRELIVKVTEVKPCTVIGKNLKSVIPAKQFHPHVPCVEPNQEIQIYFGGPIFDEKGSEVYCLAAIGRFSKYPIACIYDQANGPNVLNFLDMHIENNGIPRSIRLDQEKCLIGNQVKTFCNKNNIDIIEAPVNDHRAIGLVERLIQTIKNRLACIKEEKSSTNDFHVKHALKIIIHQLRICKRKRTKISPFGAHFGRKTNTLLSVISTIPKLSYLT